MSPIWIILAAAVGVGLIHAATRPRNQTRHKADRGDGGTPCALGDDRRDDARSDGASDTGSPSDSGGDGGGGD